MRDVQISEDAVEDLNDGCLFYEAQEPGLGEYFAACLRADVEGLRVSAGVHRVVYHDYHRLLSKVFPYGIFYTIEQERAVEEKPQREQEQGENGGWFRLPADTASARNRSTSSKLAPGAKFIILMATTRSRVRCRARYTTPCLPGQSPPAIRSHQNEFRV